MQEILKLTYTSSTANVQGQKETMPCDAVIYSTTNNVLTRKGIHIYSNISIDSENKEIKLIMYTRYQQRHCNKIHVCVCTQKEHNFRERDVLEDKIKIWHHSEPFVCTRERLQTHTRILTSFLRFFIQRIQLTTPLILSSQTINQKSTTFVQYEHKSVISIKGQKNRSLKIDTECCRHNNTTFSSKNGVTRSQSKAEVTNYISITGIWKPCNVHNTS